MSLVPSAGAALAPSTGLVRAAEFRADGVLWWEVVLSEGMNQVLRTKCHTADQRRVWEFPHHSFVIRANAIRPEQVGGWSSTLYEPADSGRF